MPEPAPTTVRVWDLPTRLFHWALAAAIVGSIASAKIGGDAMAWHFRFGYAVFALLAFRLIWGVVGGYWSRFTTFVYSPATTLRYLRGHGAAGALDIGHSPLGALSVFAMFAVLAAQVATGLVVDDEIATVGPLNRLVATDTGLAATSWHKTWGQWAVVALVSLHLAAVAFYALRRKSAIVRPMVVGDKTLPPQTPASRDGAAQRIGAALLFAACAAGVYWIVVRSGG